MTGPKRNKLITRTGMVILLAVTAVVSAEEMLKPFTDNDFFWHMATGR